MNKSGDALLLERILEPIISSLNEDAARKVLSLKADRKTQRRVSRLATKCNEGGLTTTERREYDLYLMASHIVAMLKARARILLIGPPRGKNKKQALQAKLREVLRRAWEDYRQNGGISHEQFWEDLANESMRAAKR